VWLIKDRWELIITSTLKLVDCQGEIFFGNFIPIADLQLKCCIEEWKCKKPAYRKESSGKDSSRNCIKKGPVSVTDKVKPWENPPRAHYF